MAIRVLDTSTGAVFTFPITPDQVRCTDGAQFVSYDLLGRGEVKLPGGVKLTTVDFSGILPGVARAGMRFVQSDVTPAVARTQWSRWLAEKTRLRLTVDDTDIDDAYYLSEFTTSAYGGYGDFSFEISFVRALELVIRIERPSAPGEGEAGDGGAQDRPDAGKPQSRTYRVKKGDSLWKIAEKFYKSGSKWRRIYDANRDKLKSARGLRAGQLLIIP